MSLLNFSQQERLFDPARAQPVTVIGAGSVGGWLALQLASVGCKDITVWDADDVESHNVPSSVYGRHDVGTFKVRALAEIIEDKTGAVIKTVQRMYAGEPLRGTVACCVDWMEARQLIWAKTEDNPMTDYFVDTRVSEMLVHVHGCDPCDPEARRGYGLLLYPSSEALRPMCGRHGIIHVAQLAASAACSMLTAAWEGDRKERHWRMRVDQLTQVVP